MATVSEGFLQSSGGIRLYFRRTTGDRTEKNGDGTAKKLLLLHGFGEHSQRYDELARAFADRGIEVFAIDFRGHGQSNGTRAHIERFEEYFDDVRTALAKFSNEPVLLFGHSMGGAISAAMIWKEPQRFRAAILSSPFLGLALKVNPIKTAAGRLLSAVWPSFGLPAGVKGDQLTHDPERAKAYETDPLLVATARARWFTEMEKMQKSLLTHAAEITLPIYVQHGDADVVADFSATQHFFSHLSSADKTFVPYPGLRHELVNELPKDRDLIISRVVEWAAAH